MNNKNANIRVYFKDRQTVEEECVVWAKEIVKSYKPDLIIFLAKSGFLFAEAFGKVCNCQIVDVSICRPGNKKMDFIKKVVPYIPRAVLSTLLKRKVTKDGYEDDSERYVIANPRYDLLDIKKFSKILIVDDSVDTGWSMIKCIDLLKSKGFNGEFKVASYCVLTQALRRIDVDYSLYSDSIIITATSRYSREYKKFIHDYEEWKKSYVNHMR